MLAPSFMQAVKLTKNAEVVLGTARLCQQHVTTLLSNGELKSKLGASHDTVSASLKRLQTAVRKAALFLQGYARQGFLKRMLKSSDEEATLKKIDEEISRAMSVGTACMHTSGMADGNPHPNAMHPHLMV